MSLPLAPMFLGYLYESAVHFAKEKYQSCPRVITDFCSKFESDFPLAFHCSGLKPIDHSIVESFIKGIGFLESL